MNITELRIGNLVYCVATNNIQKITGITEEHTYVNSITFDYLEFDELEPIDITEEWLIRFGFEHSDRFGFEHSDFLQDFIKDSFHLIITNNGKFISPDICRSPELKYVHQLQNLYFALTGKELNTVD